MKEEILKEFWKLPKKERTLYKLIDITISKTREETIREIASKLPRQVIGANLNIEKRLNKLKK